MAAGRSPSFSNFWSGQKGDKFDPTGFYDYLVEDNQRSDVFHHVLGFAGATLMIGSGVPISSEGGQFFAMYQMGSDLTQMTDLDRAKSLEALAEIAGNSSGMLAGAELAKFIQGRQANAEELRQRLRAILCK